MSSIEEAKGVYQQAKEAFARQQYDQAVALSKNVAQLGLGVLVGKPLETIGSAAGTLDLDDHMLHIVNFFEDRASLVTDNASKCLRYAKELLAYVEDTIAPSGPITGPGSSDAA